MSWGVAVAIVASALLSYLGSKDSEQAGTEGESTSESTSETKLYGRTFDDGIRAAIPITTGSSSSSSNASTSKGETSALTAIGDAVGAGASAYSASTAKTNEDPTQVAVDRGMWESESPSLVNTPSTAGALQGAGATTTPREAYAALTDAEKEEILQALGRQ